MMTLTGFTPLEVEVIREALKTYVERERAERALHAHALQVALGVGRKPTRFEQTARRLLDTM